MKTKIQEKTSLLTVLQQLSPDSSKNTLKSWVEQGRVSVDNVRVDTYMQDLLPGQEVSIGPKISFSDAGVKILYEDRDLVVIEKPDRLLSVASLSETEKTAHAILKRRLRRMVYPVHRLDRETSGVMIFAYTPEARDHLKEQFLKHSIERVYYAYVEGAPSPKKGTWRSHLVEDDFYFVKSIDEQPQRRYAKTPLKTSFKAKKEDAPKLAITHYEVIEEKSGISLVKFKLETGRKNQIRVHASEAGFPIVGDCKYGAQTQRRGRLCLHAHILGFEHPTKKKTMKFVSPLPAYFSCL
jgi:tRNA pseudouridine32 synthase/23S rRNA pseudouridine746 synthase/23S rRNA pseudouridine1911/1915/1917 synthase